ncbi:hypothetical protein DPMN_040282 [Dreissena polymorpha]|uniref:Uncharacterized protein n=1 Tax=Dreissena polymorpha TaxID=45954 RepID=A0A9D4CVQ0_DREPO|nr:hypothetical protein DPMN_040282 [Dreissena polymorpha]
MGSRYHGHDGRRPQCNNYIREDTKGHCRVPGTDVGFSQKRVELEMLFLEFLNRWCQSFYENGEFDIDRAFILCFECKFIEVHERIHHDGSPAIGLFDIFKRLLM